MKTLPDRPDRLDSRSRAWQHLYRIARMTPLMPSPARYNMTICHQKRFIWFRVAKVGTRTILNHFKGCEIHLDVEHGNWLHYPINSYEDYFKFAFVRNPWDRLVSCWRNKVVENNYFKFDETELRRLKLFENFVDYVSGLDIDDCDRHLRSQSVMVDLNRVDFLGRMETFDDDASYIFWKLGLRGMRIVRKNVTSDKRTYQEYYSKQLADKVSQIYRKDIQIFGYQSGGPGRGTEGI